jgi:hypothetical protein
MFQRSGIDPQDYEGKWVKVSGVIGSYRGKPQMLIETPSQIQLLSSEQEARQWLGGQTPTNSTVQMTQQKIQSGESVFNTLYAGRSVTPIQTRPQHQSSVSTPNRSAHSIPSSKKPFDSSHGIVGSIIVGIVGIAVFGLWGLIIGAFIGYQIGKRI